MEEIREGTITEFRQQKRKQNRLSVYLDGQYAFGVSALVGAKLHVGQRLGPADVKRLLSEDQYETAKQRAFRYLSLRPRSQVELRRYLAQKSFSEEVIQLVITRLAELDMLDDLAFARYWVEQRETFKPRGRAALRYELRKKGVSRTIVEEVLADIDEEAAARKAAEKRVRRWRHMDYETFRTKLSQYLQRRGFHYGIIRPLVQELWDKTRPVDGNNDVER